MTWEVRGGLQGGNEEKALCGEAEWDERGNTAAAWQEPATRLNKD